jgi:DNA-binding NtrC family response regulator
MNILLLSKDTDVIGTVRTYAGDDHRLTVVDDLDDARTEIVGGGYDAVLMDCSIRPTDLIGLSVEITDVLSRTVVLLIGPLDIEQREELGRRLSAQYSIDKPLRGRAFSETMQKVEMRVTIVRETGLIGRSQVMEDVIRTIMQIGSTPINVLITGESGSGKEVVARALHAVSLRADKPFLAVNCAALAEGVLESELFGHEKGAFTGAVSRRLGMFERAHNGTIFLDEIGEIPRSTQIRLLRVLEEREITRVGGTDIIPVDVRIITATNRNLDRQVADGRFRRDLYYRIKVLEIKAPALRDRREDIPLLIDAFAESYARINNLPLRRFNESAAAFLARADWPGNVRELRNAVESSLALTKALIIGPGDIPAHLLHASETRALPVPTDHYGDNAERELIYRMLLEIKSDVTEIKGILRGQEFPHEPEFVRDPMEVSPADTRDGTLDDLEREAIIESLRQNNGNRRLAAEQLGIGERTLYRKLKQFDIQ